MTNLNFELYNSLNLEDEDLIYLFSAKEINKQKLETIPDDVLRRLQEASLLKSIKGSPKENPLHKLRISDKAKKLFITPKYTEDEEILYKWLSEYYTLKKKEIGHPERVKNLLLWFKQETGFEKNRLIWLLQHFLSNEYVDENSRVLEYTLFAPKKITLDNKTIAYCTTPDIYDSWLFNHYRKNKEEIDIFLEKKQIERDEMDRLEQLKIK